MHGAACRSTDPVLIFSCRTASDMMSARTGPAGVASVPLVPTAAERARAVGFRATWRRPSEHAASAQGPTSAALSSRSSARLAGQLGAGHASDCSGRHGVA